jgi:hypothetical protein
MEKEPVGLAAVEAIGQQLDFSCWYPKILVNDESVNLRRKEKN